MTQTGVQLLTGFLLTLPFQPQFATLSGLERGDYLAAVLFAVAATVLLITPVGMHRILFRRHQLRTLVTTAHRCALAGLVSLGLALTCVVTLTVSVVLEVALGLGAGAAAAGLFGFFLAVLAVAAAAPTGAVLSRAIVWYRVNVLGRAH